jgi:hypothetical protein
VFKSQTYTTTVGIPVTLTASWPGNYNWTNSASTRSTTITPSAVGSVVYTVSDAFGCISDNYTVQASATLPVRLIRFSAKAMQNFTLLEWATADETQNKRFHVERSADGNNFSQIGTVNAADQATYSFRDLNPIKGDNYYRLVQEDLDGHLTILSTKKIAFGRKALTMKVLSSGENRVVLEINPGLSKSANCRIYDVLGKEYQRIVMNNINGTAVKQLTLHTGMYVCELTNDKGQKIVRQIMIQ